MLRRENTGPQKHHTPGLHVLIKINEASSADSWLLLNLHRPHVTSTSLSLSDLCLIEIKVRIARLCDYGTFDDVSCGSGMPTIESTPIERSRWVALLVSRSRRRTLLSPFFAKCDGLLLIDPLAPVREFWPNGERTREFTCSLVLSSGAKRLVCGFIACAEQKRLAAAGIDVRVGSCAQ